jgi:hypothetical protein
VLHIHPNARTTPAVRMEIARSTEPTGVLAARFGVSTETVRKRRRRSLVPPAPAALAGHGRRAPDRPPAAAGDALPAG